MKIFSDSVFGNATLIWSISSFFLGIFLEELKQLYKERGKVKLLKKRMDLIYGTFDENGKRTTTMNGSPMIKGATVHISIFNDSRRTRTIRNIRMEGKVKGGDHFKIDFSEGKVPPSFVINSNEIKSISINGEIESLTSFMPFLIEDLTIELVYGLDNGDTKYTQFTNPEISVIEIAHTEWKVY